MYCKRVLLALLAAALGALTGCVNFQVDEHSYQFNEATGSLSLRLLLLNAVRASQDYPLQFTKISSYEGSGTTGGSVSASLPLSFQGSGTIAPRVDVKDGISQLNLVDLSTAEAQQALRKTLRWQVYEYFYTQSGNRSSVAPFLLMVESMRASEPMHNLVSSFVAKKCEAYLGKDAGRFSHDLRLPQKQAACRELKALEAPCGSIGSYVPAIGPYRAYKNETTSECHFNAFLSARFHITVLGALWAKAPKGAQADKKGDKTASKSAKAEKDGNTFNISVPVNVAVSEGKLSESKSEQESEDQIILYVGDHEFGELCSRALPKGHPYGPSPRMCDHKRGGYATVHKDHALFQLRTPERMVRYLGELIAAQSYGPKRFIPEVLDLERRQRYKLLVVTRGAAPQTGAAVSVRSPDGEMFHIPRRDPDAAKTDISMETLSIVSDILNQAVSNKSFPAVTSLTVRSGN
jgi:hypothetical protein